MKILKFSLTGIFCFLILAGVIAFTPSQPKISRTSKKQVATVFAQWFIYNNGIALSFSDASNPNNYRPMNPGELCTGTQTLCAIYAESDPFYPSRPLITFTQPVYGRLLDYFGYGITSPYKKLKNYF